MVASIITNDSVPAGLDITNLLRAEKVTVVDVFTPIRGFRPANHVLKFSTVVIAEYNLSSSAQLFCQVKPSLSSSFAGWLS